MEDFVNIEREVIHGKSLLKVNDSTSLHYIDLVDGEKIENPNVSEYNIECNIECNINTKPEMLVMEDNSIVKELQKYIIDLKDTINFDVTSIPMLIALLLEKLDYYDFNMNIKKDYIFYILKWINQKFFNESYTSNRKNLIKDVYLDIIDVYKNIKNFETEYTYVNDVPQIDNFISYLLKNNLLEKNNNVFSSIWQIMLEINGFPIFGYQKKLYVLNILGKLSTRNIFVSEIECQKMIDAFYIYPNFIDTVACIQKKYHPKKDEKNIGCSCFPFLPWNTVKYF